MFTPGPDIRRRLDGSIDIDFYRQKGLMERRAYMTNLFIGAKGLLRPLVAAAILAGTLFMLPSRDGMVWSGSLASGNAMNGAATASTRPSTTLKNVASTAPAEDAQTCPLRLHRPCGRP